MTNEWVNAVIEITTPLDVSADASDAEKWEATHKAADVFWESMPKGNRDWVGTEHWEIQSDD
jgi:hypothetical protein